MKESNKRLQKKETGLYQIPSGKSLYDQYGAMLYGYILQFIPDKEVADQSLINIFSHIYTHIDEGIRSSQGIVIWMLGEARKLLIPQLKPQKTQVENEKVIDKESNRDTFNVLFNHVSEQQKYLFIESYYKGRPIEQIAQEINLAPEKTAELLKATLLTLRKALQ